MRVIPFLLTSAFAALVACSEPQSDQSQRLPITDASATVAPDGSPAIWTLSDADTTVHLFGTVHILKPDTDWQTIEFSQIFERSDAIYFEADVTSEAVLSRLPPLVARLAPFTNGETLSTVLEPTEINEVREAAEIVGLPMQSLDGFRPWFVSQILSDTHLGQIGFDRESGVERVLGNLAKKAGKPVRYLETAEEQIEILAGFSDDDTAALLVDTAVSIEEEPELLSHLVDDWAAGDTDGLAANLIEDEAFGAPAIYRGLLVERNTDWAEQIKALMRDEAGTFLIAVGAAHLLGPDSVQSLLEHDGYIVARR